jgi:hypothetical protein
MKRKHELQRRKAEAQLQMLKVKQQMEAEAAIETEKNKESLEQLDNGDQEEKSEEKPEISLATVKVESHK